MSTPVRIPKSSPSPISKASAKSSQSRTPNTYSSSHSSPKPSNGSLSKTASPRRHSRPELMSSSLRSQDDYLAYEIPSGDTENGGLGSVVIIPKSSQGFSWNEDVFLSKYHLNNLASPKRLSSSAELGSYRDDSGMGSSDDGRDDDFVDVHEIHIENDHTEPWWDDLA